MGIAFASSLFRSDNIANNRVRFVPAVPGLQVGDGLLCVLTKKNAASPVTPPAGYVTHVDNGINYVGSKIADAGDVAATIHDFIFASGLSSEQGVLMRFTDVMPSNFVDTFMDVGSGNSPIVTPADTASRAALWVIYGTSNSSFNRSGALHSGPGGFTERHDRTSFEIGLGLYTRDAEIAALPSQIITPTTPANLASRGGAIALLGVVPDFQDQEEAEARAREKTADGTWPVAHSERTFLGASAVRFQRFMSPGDPGAGAWVETTDTIVT
jgi:hypothetical protein